MVKQFHTVSAPARPAVAGGLTNDGQVPAARHAVLDPMHVGDIVGALGTIRQHDLAPRSSWRKRLITLLVPSPSQGWEQLTQPTR
jgi:hypothetical protein